MVKTFEGNLSFKGGLRKMLDSKRIREGRGPKTTSDASNVLPQPLDGMIRRGMQQLELQRIQMELLKGEAEIAAMSGTGGAAAGGAASGATPVAGGASSSGDSATGTTPGVAAGGTSSAGANVPPVSTGRRGKGYKKVRALKKVTRPSIHNCGEIDGLVNFGCMCV